MGSDGSSSRSIGCSFSYTRTGNSRNPNSQSHDTSRSSTGSTYPWTGGSAAYGTPWTRQSTPSSSTKANTWTSQFINRNTGTEPLIVSENTNTSTGWWRRSLGVGLPTDINTYLTDCSFTGNFPSNTYTGNNRNSNSQLHDIYRPASWPTGGSYPGYGGNFYGLGTSNFGSDNYFMPQFRFGPSTLGYPSSFQQRPMLGNTTAPLYQPTNANTWAGQLTGGSSENTNTSTGLWRRSFGVGSSTDITNLTNGSSTNTNVREQISSSSGRSLLKVESI